MRCCAHSGWCDAVCACLRASAAAMDSASFRSSSLAGSGGATARVPLASSTAPPAAVTIHWVLRPWPFVTSALVISTGSPGFTFNLRNWSSRICPTFFTDVEGALGSHEHVLLAAELAVHDAAFQV